MTCRMLRQNVPEALAVRTTVSVKDTRCRGESETDSHPATLQPEWLYRSDLLPFEQDHPADSKPFWLEHARGHRSRIAPLGAEVDLCLTRLVCRRYVSGVNGYGQTDRSEAHG